MKELISPKSHRFQPIWLVVLMIAGLIAVPSAQAKVYLSNGGGDTSEGDPLDANDFGTGNDDPNGGDIQDSHSAIHSGDGGLIIQGPAALPLQFIIIEMPGDFPVFRVFLIQRDVSISEGSDAR